jgi:hypothetical protein
MRPVRWGVIMLVVCFGVAACGGSSSGPVGAAPGTFSVLRPCSLLSPGDRGRLGAAPGRLPSAAAPYCRFVAGSVTVDVTYFNDLGLARSRTRCPRRR